MELLKVIDSNNYAELTEVNEKHSVRGIISRGGRFAMQRSKDGEYKIPGGGVEPGESFIQALEREIREETGLLIMSERVKGLGEIIEKRRDIFNPKQIYICKSRFYYCPTSFIEVPLSMTQSEIEKGYHLVWATLEEIYLANRKIQKDPWIVRDTLFIEMMLEGKVCIDR